MITNHTFLSLLTELLILLKYRTTFKATLDHTLDLTSSVTIYCMEITVYCNCMETSNQDIL